MGTTAHVVVVTPSDDLAATALAHARTRLEQLESRWSRFRTDSEIARLNRVSGSPAIVSADTRALVARAVEGWERTAGRFDPTVLDAMVALGYDRDFDEVSATAATSPCR